MKYILTTSLFLSVCFASFSQLNLKNNLDKPYNFSVAIFYSSFRYSGWITKGWFHLNPGEEIQIFEKNPREKYLYYYAVSETDTISGHKKFLVNPKESTFIIEGALLHTTKAHNPNYEWYKFKEVKIKRRERKGKAMVLEINP